MAIFARYGGKLCRLKWIKLWKKDGFDVVGISGFYNKKSVVIIPLPSHTTATRLEIRNPPVEQLRPSSLHYLRTSFSLKFVLPTTLQLLTSTQTEIHRDSFARRQVKTLRGKTKTISWHLVVYTIELFIESKEVVLRYRVVSGGKRPRNTLVAIKDIEYSLA